MRHSTRILLALLLVAAGALAAQPAYAHGFGERYDLPVPLGYYMVGAGATVALSFVVIGVFVRAAPGLYGYRRHNLFSHKPLAALLQSRAFTVAAQAAAVFLFLLVVATGLFGDPSPSANFAPTFVWVIWWVSLGFFVALVGNLWALMNPWSVLFGWAEAVKRRFRPDSDLDLGFEYPAQLGAWPAFALFLVFAWLENAFPGASDPLNIALLVLAYSLVTWAGMFLFGRRVWLRYGEGFSVVFGFLARFAPTEVRVISDDCADCEAACGPSEDGCVNCYACWERADPGERELNLRPWAVGLARRENVTTDILVFVILALAAVTFDGFKSTPLWLDIKVGLWDAWSALLGAGEFSSNARIAADTLGLVVFPAVFLMAYLLFSQLMAYAAGEDEMHRLRGSPPFRVLPSADSPGIQHRPLLHPPGDTGSAHHPSGVGPLRLRLGPVRHRRLQGQHRPGRRQVRVGAERRRHRPGAHHRRLPVPRHRPARHARPSVGHAQPVPHAWPDGDVHRHQPVDCGPAHCGARLAAIDARFRAG